jgi:hypothetical protein
MGERTYRTEPGTDADELVLSCLRLRGPCLESRRGIRGSWQPLGRDPGSHNRSRSPTFLIGICRQALAGHRCSGFGDGRSASPYLIASTKRVWVIDDRLSPVLRYEPRYHLSGAPRLIEGSVVMPEYDFDGENEIIEQDIELGQGL